MLSCRNELDAKQRIIQLVQLEGRHDLRYDIPILFVTWEKEPLEDVKVRVRAAPVIKRTSQLKNRLDCAPIR